MTNWIISGFLLAVILLAMVIDGRRNGMLVTRRDWTGFAVFVGSLCCLGAAAWSLAALIWPEQQMTGTIILFVAGALFVQIVLAGHNRRQQARRLERSGFLTQREFAKRVDDALARIHPSR